MFPVGTDVKIDLTQSVATRELGRFFEVARARGDSVTVMPACPVDTLWHEFRTQGEEFSTFCLQHADGEVAHREATGFGTIEWVNLYHSMFGESLPPIWFFTPDGQRFDSDAWEAYHSGELRLSWDCTPEIKQKKPFPMPPGKGVRSEPRPQALPGFVVKRLTV